MAILKNIKFTINVDGQSLKENEDEDEINTAPNVTSKYIEATSDANFAIIRTLLELFKFFSSVLCFDVFLEGK